MKFHNLLFFKFVTHVNRNLFFEIENSNRNDGVINRNDDIWRIIFENKIWTQVEISPPVPDGTDPFAFGPNSLPVPTPSKGVGSAVDFCPSFGKYDVFDSQDHAQGSSMESDLMRFMWWR